MDKSTIGIIGGGPSAMSCALWLHQLGHAPVIIEQHNQLGGQLLDLHRTNRWLLGQPNITSAELATQYASHIAQLGIHTLLNCRLLDIVPEACGFRLFFEHLAFKPFFATALVIASGARPKGRESFAAIPGFVEAEKTGQVSFFPTSHLALLPSLAGKSVIVIGGGDNAYFTAKDTALAGANTLLLRRGESKAGHAIRNEIATLISQRRLHERPHSHIAAFCDMNGQIGITLENNQTVSADWVFARLGFIANTEFLDQFPVFNGLAKKSGYLCVDEHRRTSLPWIYGIGDVARSDHQSVVSALADGAVAAYDLNKRMTLCT